MKRFLRIVAGVAASVALLAALAVALVYVASEPILRRTYDVALQPISVPTDPASIAEGRRLALVRGCLDGCHGKGVSGGVFMDELLIAKVVSPDLTRVAAQLSDSELERVIRHGVKLDGRTTWIMPSPMFFHLSDADLGRIIAFLRSLPEGDGPKSDVRLGPLGRLMILQYPQFASALEIAESAPRMTEAQAQGEHGRGRYLALTVCSECHGMDLKGHPEESVPDLALVAAYSKPQFERLMATGVPMGGQKLGLMEEVALTRFSQMTTDEVGALYNYLKARAGAAVN